MHRGEQEKDHRYPPSDKRHHWKKGVVVAIADEEFVVEVEVEHHARTHTHTRSATPLHSPYRVNDV